MDLDQKTMEGASKEMYAVEYYKATQDYFKHLTTLSTGSIVLIATFLDRVFAQPKGKFLAILSIIGFVISVIACVIEQTITLMDKPGAKRMVWWTTAGGVSIVFAWTGFLLGIISLSIFAIRNLL
jgi:hypothetical protein